MSEEPGADKPHDPTPKKLEDARKRGEIAKSNDLITASAYAGLLLSLLALGSGPFLSTANGLRTILDHADAIAAQTVDGDLTTILGPIMLQAATGSLAWFIFPMLFAVACIIGQRAFLIAPSRIAPKLNRISPIQGIKTKFGRQGLFEFAKSFAKLTVYSVALALYLAAQKDRIIATINLSPGQIASELGEMSITILSIVLSVAIALGILDYQFQKTEHLRKNRMSRKELLDEMKSSEGDPLMKQKRRQKAIDIAMTQMLTDVPEASVVVVNPTHYAVALKWSGKRGTAPICVAKGVDEMAARIREIAIENGVPIHSDPPSARALHATAEIGAEIPPDLYGPVAAAIRFADDLRRRMKGRR